MPNISALRTRQPKNKNSPSHVYYTIGIVLFVVACGTILARILVRFLPTNNYIARETFFDILVQIIMLGVAPTLLYFFLLDKKTPKDIMEFSNMRPTKRANLLIAIPLGLFLLLTSMGISTIWQVFLVILGYNHSPAVDYLPEVFNPLLLVLMLFLTAVLPGVFEEFTMRGGFLTVIRQSFDLRYTLWICAVAFGLFHSYIPQLFYTACFGAVMAYVVITTKSIYPAMIIHFLNNGIGVYLEFAEKYGWFMGDFYDGISYLATTNILILFVLYVISVSIAFGLLLLLYNINKTKTLERKRDIISRSGYDNTNKRVVIVGEFDEKTLAEAEMGDEVFGKGYRPDYYKPTLRDNAWYIGAIVVTALATIFSFIWGMF